jgi:hypothetical protein
VDVKHGLANVLWGGSMVPLRNGSETLLCVCKVWVGGGMG